MADQNKISFDINVSDSGQKQINNYVKSFDNLLSSITNLSQPFNSLSDD